MKDKIYRAVPVEDFKINTWQYEIVFDKNGHKYAACGLSNDAWINKENGKELSNITHVLEAVSLPGEEEIGQQAERYCRGKFPENKGEKDCIYIGFVEGVHWLRKLIIGK